MINLSEIENIVGGRVLAGEPMRNHTTFGIGGPCDFLVEVKSLTELKSVIELARAKKIPYFLIGCGSNLLVKDKGIRGIVVRLAGDFAKVEFKGESVFAGGGCLIQKLVKSCTENELGGMEFLAGIPGTIGGAVRMNAGTNAGSIETILKSASILDENGGIRQASRGELEFSYRNSGIPEKSVVISAEFELKKSKKNDIIKKLTELMNFRFKTQPVGFRNAGCVFKNPPGDYAAALIDKAGLKGAKSGGAVVSELHANYINNAGGATAQDVLSLAEKIKAEVREKYFKELEFEIKIVGE